jgi:S-methylmethionine-dependent homocysteine/selenocysteine methylase
VAKYRNDLPQMGNDVFLTDGGLETTLVFHKGMELPAIAAFVLLQNNKGIATLTDYFHKYISIAKKHSIGLVLETPTWRASSKWGAILGYSEEALESVNRKAIDLLMRIRDEHETDKTKLIISGCIGPKGDGYVIDEKMTADSAEKYHASQIETFSNTEADLVTAFTITYSDEAIGMVRAAKLVKMPIVIGFTVETDGKLPSRQTIKDAIETVDKATSNYASYYMINCAHPTHFQESLSGDESWKQRIQAVRANASTKSHAELNESEELDDGNPSELGRQYKLLRAQLNNLNVLGGCCGTDHRHVEAICQSIVGYKI